MALTIDGTNGIETNTDTGQIKLGTDDDLQIYHNGSHSYVQGSTGNLLLRPKSGKDGVTIIPDGAVKLAFNDTLKFETTNAGIDINGGANCYGDIWVGDTKKIKLGDSNDLEITHDGTDATIKNITGDLKIEALGGTSDDVLISANDDFVVKVAATETAITASANGGVALYYNDSKKFETGTNGTITWGTAYHEAGGIMATYAHTGTGETIRFRANTSSTVGNVSVGASSTAYNTSSDYRLKENQVSISDGITRLKTLKPYRFNFKVEPSKTVDGFFAHEVTAVPEAITGEKDGTEMQSIDQSKLVPLLTAALQEAITKIETLETKVAALEAA